MENNTSSSSLLTLFAMCFFFYKTTEYVYYHNTSAINKVFSELYEHFMHILDLMEQIQEMQDEFYLDKIEDDDKNNETSDNCRQDLIENKIKYEDKYLEKIRKITNEYVFTEYEKQLEDIKFNEFLLTTKENDDKEEPKYEIFFTEKEAREKAQNYIINERLDKLINNFVIDSTPLGNVIMLYNNKKEVFEYYSDNTIPYRFLETVARKYVITYFCRPLYIDMDEELKESELKLFEQEIKDKKKIEDDAANKTNVVAKKSVFAKFKSYNKEAWSGKVNKAPPPKNSIPNKATENKNNDNKLIIKEKANRYNCQGKIANFSILKKVDKKMVNKKYAMTFSEFKKKFSG